MDLAQDPPPAQPRTLVACAACGRQYDASGRALGTQLRCACGATIEVRSTAARTPRRLRCAHCGAALPAQGESCSYCSAPITLEERGLCELCPCCAARLFSGARYCMDCGVAIAPQALSAVGADTRCPRCSGSLRTRALGTDELIECTSCAGLWVEARNFERLCSQAETTRLSEAVLPAALPAAAPPPMVREGYLPCLSCGQLMLRKNFGGTSGIVVDLCRDHGLWFDHRELERILEFVRKGGLLRARAREVKRLEQATENARDLNGSLAGSSASGWIERDEPEDLLGGLLSFLGSAVSRSLRTLR